MNKLCFAVSVSFLLLAPFDGISHSCRAELTSAQRKELADIRKEVSRAMFEVRRRNYDKAEEAFDDCEARLKTLAEEAGLEENDKLLSSVVSLITSGRKSLDLKKNPEKARQLQAGVVSFTTDVAPVLNENCLDCHASRGRGGLRLDTFQAIKAGGESGAIFVPGNASRSRLVAALMAPPNRRMPRNRDPLPRAQIDKIVRWINQGARFDGDGETVALRDLKRGSGSTEIKPVEIAMATGEESVSFKEDIAPFIVEHCLRCHGQYNPRNGLSLTTFTSLMKGGDSGVIVSPGSLEDSLLWDLVGKQDPIKMPAGDGRITVENHSNLRTWILEGAKYDGADPNETLESLVPSEEDVAANRFANMTATEFEDYRKEQTAAAWKRVLSKDEPRVLETEEFLLYGDVSEFRLESIAQWADEYAVKMRKDYDVGEGTVWRGKLAVYVYADRFGYEEFNLTINRRQIPPEATGHSVVNPTQSDAYIVLQDVGDQPDETSPGLRINLIDHLTGAYLQQKAENLPEWLIRGTGLAKASAETTGNYYLDELTAKAVPALQRLRRPEDVFDEGTFSPAEVGPVGFTVVSFMLRTGGGTRLNQLIKLLQDGTEFDAAVRRVYRKDRRGLANAYRTDMLRQLKR